MTAVSPYTASGGLVTFTVTSNGATIPGTIQIEAIETWCGANKVPRARLTILDGDADTETFPVSESNTFVPGAEIDIQAGYDSQNKTIFKGVVVGQGLEFGPRGCPRLIVEIADKALRMTLERNCAVFKDVTDSDLISKLLADNGLAKSVAATTVLSEEMVQYYCTDWDMMLTRAEANGMVVIVDAGKVTVAAPDTSQSPVLEVVYGQSILDIAIEMDATTQLRQSVISGSSWDYATQKPIQAKANPVPVTEAGNLSSETLAKVFDLKQFPQVTGAPQPQDALQAWSSAELLRSRLSKIRGTVGFQGSALAKAGGTLSLAGLGGRFNGPVWINGVSHCIRDGRWITTVEFGLAAQWFATRAANIPAPGASGLLPPIGGLQTGIVKQVNADPLGAFRVLVNLPLVSSTVDVWARLATFYAGNKAGAVFYPEIGDEVVLGFMNDDPRDPIILGSLYSKARPPAVTPDENNTKKALSTPTELQITFDDKDKVIEVKTPGNNKVRLDDKASSITIEDGNGSSIKMEKSGVTIDSAGSLTLKAKSNVSVDAGANLNLAAKADAKMNGLQVALTAQTKFSAKGSAAAELSASGMCTVSGAMVKIN